MNLCEVVSLYAAVWATPCSLSYLLLNRKTFPDQAEMGMEMINYRSKLIKWCTRAICQKPQSKHYLQQKKILLHNIWLHHKQIYSTSDVQFSVRALNSSKFSIENEPQFWTWIFETEPQSGALGTDALLTAWWFWETNAIIAGQSEVLQVHSLKKKNKECKHFWRFFSYGPGYKVVFPFLNK